MKKVVVFIAAFLAVASAPAFAQTTPADTSASTEERVYEKVEKEPSVNVKEWRRHLEAQLGAYIDKAVMKGIKPGNYTVIVRFLVEKDGRVTDVKALNDPGYGLGGGAVSTVRTGPKWIAGETNGRKVRSYHMQPINFQISEM